MAKKRYEVRLSRDERVQLEGLISKGRSPARMLARARIVLKADGSSPAGGWTDQQIAAALDCSIPTVERVRKQYVTEGLQAVLSRRRRSRSRARRLDGAGEARLIALACSEPPEGHARWTMQMLADRLIQWEAVTVISDETVRRTLKKTISSRG